MISSPSRPRTSRLAHRLPGSLPDVAAFLVLAGLLVWLFLRGSENLGYHWQWYAVPRYLVNFTDSGPAAGLLLQGLWLTLAVSALALPLTFALGLCSCLLALSPSFTGRVVARGYLETIRNTPLLIQIFVVYFVLAPLLDMDRFWAGVLALALFEGAYASEIMRGGILSLPRGQWEAAHSLGLSTLQTYSRVILPQALRRVLPPLTGQAVSLVKDSALLSTISIFELTLRAQQVVSDTFMTFEIWFTTAALYLAVTFTLSAASRTLERRLRATA
ncbi:polar amino acid ABC transporter, inner membrane subunit [Desulfovibrio sp. X2]|uniref:amino acid ABC transporter permease n=1 Tax=Desulfovibrio sp. X2 TaxID=941449 RepID=UPI0003589DB2|nr:amino acid ABC transporter permease [Desulfovibrio sp. X2]EPR44791.1 polar amino acid ABC transporter, inner membrane subunit [Desulfovibrio sp. X2]